MHDIGLIVNASFCFYVKHFYQINILTGYMDETTEFYNHLAS